MPGSEAIVTHSRMQMHTAIPARIDVTVKLTAVASPPHPLVPGGRGPQLRYADGICSSPITTPTLVLRTIGASVQSDAHGTITSCENYGP